MSRRHDSQRAPGVNQNSHREKIWRRFLEAVAAGRSDNIAEVTPRRGLPFQPVPHGGKVVPHACN